MPATRERSDVERFNTFVFVAVLVAVVLSFVTVPAVFVVEAVARAAVVLLVGYGLVRWQREYFSHWTSWLCLLLAVVSVLRLAQVFV